MVRVTYCDALVDYTVNYITVGALGLKQSSTRWRCSLLEFFLTFVRRKLRNKFVSSPGNKKMAGECVCRGGGMKKERPLFGVVRGRWSVVGLG